MTASRPSTPRWGLVLIWLGGGLLGDGLEGGAVLTPLHYPHVTASPGEHPTRWLRALAGPYFFVLLNVPARLSSPCVDVAHEELSFRNRGSPVTLTDAGRTQTCDLSDLVHCTIRITLPAEGQRRICFLHIFVVHWSYEATSCGGLLTCHPAPCPCPCPCSSCGRWLSWTGRSRVHTR
jgi:hypothetical protein